MNNYEFWDELGKIFNAVVAYQEKSIEFNKRFINPWIRLGNVFDKQERNREAIHAYQKAIEIDPTNAQNWCELGNAYFRMEAYDDAVQAYNKAIELAADSGWPYSNLALTLVAQGRSAEAIPLYQKSIELFTNPKDKAIAWNRLGNAYRKLNEYELALQAFQKADELDRENAGFRDELDETANEPTVIQPERDAKAATPPIQIVQVERFVDEGARDSSPSNGAGDHASLASESAIAPLADHRAPPAASKADNVEAAPPSGQPAGVAETTVVAQNTVEMYTVPLDEAVVTAETAEAASLMAVAEVQTEDSDSATASAAPRRVPEDEPGPGRAIDAEATLVEAVPEEQGLSEEVAASEAPLEEPPGARAVADEAAGEAINPQGEQAPEGQAGESDLECEAQIPDLEAIAEERFSAAEEAAALEPTEAGLASLEEQPEEREAGSEAGPSQELEEVAFVEEGLSQHAAYEEFLKDNPEPPLALPEEEAEACNEALSDEFIAKIDASGEVHLEMDARNAHVWNELGNIYFNSGAYDDAILAYSKAIELDRYFAWPYSNLALTYVQKGRFAEAILLYQRSIELFKDDRDKAISWNRLGNVYRRLNDYESAIAAYQRADELDPANTTISLQSRFSLLGHYPSNQKAKVTS